MNKDTVRDTIDKRTERAGAYVIIDKNGKHCATVRVGYPKDDAGRLYVDVRHTMTGLAYCAASQVCIADLPKGSHYVEGCNKLFRYQVGTANGYGYDKLTAALTGLIVCGHTLADHCGNVPEDEAKRARLMKRYQREAAKNNVYILSERDDYWRDAAKRIGCEWANWRDGRYTSLHFISDLARLATFGFTVIRAV